MTKKIIIIGGGVAGLTTAHELLKKGFLLFQLKMIKKEIKLLKNKLN